VGVDRICPKAVPLCPNSGSLGRVEAVAYGAIFSLLSCSVPTYRHISTGTSGPVASQSVESYIWDRTLLAASAESGSMEACNPRSKGTSGTEAKQVS
jgi:hypothetical protein